MTHIYMTHIIWPISHDSYGLIIISNQIIFQFRRKTNGTMLWNILAKRWNLSKSENDQPNHLIMFHLFNFLILSVVILSVRLRPFEVIWGHYVDWTKLSANSRSGSSKYRRQIWIGRRNHGHYSDQEDHQHIQSKFLMRSFFGSQNFSQDTVLL